MPPSYLPEWYDDKPDVESADLVAVIAESKTSGVDAALTVGGSINGTVTDEGTGAPLSDICVVVRDPSFSVAGFGFTDADGAYSAGGLVAGDYKVRFFDCGDDPTYVPEWYDDKPDFGSADPVAVIAQSKTSGVDAALTVAASINGTVTDQDTGAPLSDICVEVFESGSDFFGFGFTDADGAYSVGGLQAGDYAVGFFDCGPTTHVSEWYDDKPNSHSADLVAVTAGSKTSGINAALAVGGSINGTVTDEDTGAPLSDICVDVTDRSFSFFGGGFTRADGSYSVGGLPAGDYTVGFFECFGTTYVREWYDDQPDFGSADPVAVTAESKTSGIDAALAVGGSINGTVTDEDTGAPLSEICVDVVDPSFGPVVRGFTDADGSYSVGGVPAGDYTVGFFDCVGATYAQEWYDDKPNFESADLVAVIAESKTSGIDAALAAGGSINGTVTDEGTGAPLSDICVDVFDFRFNFVAFGFTAADGGYSVGGLPAGDYTVSFFDCIAATYVLEWYDDNPDPESADLVAVIAESKTSGINAALAVGGSINGTVTAEGTGAPLSNVCVDVIDVSFTYFANGFTDADGSYSVGGLAAGDYTVGFFDCGDVTAYLTEYYDDQPGFSSADLVAVTAGSKTSGINAALAPRAPLGDVSCDGIVNSIDPLLILQFVADFLGSLSCESAADVDLNGLIESLDALIILQFIAGLVGSLPP